MSIKALYVTFTLLLSHTTQVYNNTFNYLFCEGVHCTNKNSVQHNFVFFENVTSIDNIFGLHSSNVK